MLNIQGGETKNMRIIRIGNRQYGIIRTTDARCRLCSLADVDAIETSRLQDGATYDDIVESYPELSRSGLSRHFSRHVRLVPVQEEETE
ncbi:MAG: hypothetical protein ACE5H0_13665, partial [Bacteroidota bacterium]